MNKQNNPEKNKTQTIKKLKVLHWNCNAITNKYELLKLFIINNNIDIISLNEIKCKTVQANLILITTTQYINVKVVEWHF